MNVSAQEKAACRQCSAVAQCLTAAELASMDQWSVHIHGAPGCLWHIMPSACWNYCRDVWAYWKEGVTW